MKSTAEILGLLAGFKAEAQKNYGVSRIGVFGSVARGEQTEKSDVDVCYEGEALSLLTLDLLQSDIENLLTCPVDLVRLRPNMRPLLRQRIDKEGIFV